jgi:hypothetical protein
MAMELAPPQISAHPGPQTGMSIRLTSRERRVSLCETLDRVLNKGAVIAGDIVISVAGVDLLYIGLNLMVTSVETMRGWSEERTFVGGSASGAGSAGTATDRVGG